MIKAAPAPADGADALTPLGYALPPHGPVPALTRRIIELLRVGRGDSVIDLCCRDGLSSLAILDEVRDRNGIGSVSPFGERLARLLATSGVPTVQMGALGFGRFPMRYDKVLLRGGFTRFRSRPRRLLAPLFERLEPGARFLVVDSAPSADAPLFAKGLRRWERQHCPAEAVASILDDAGFATEIDVVTSLREVAAVVSFAWIAYKGWPILQTFSKADLQDGLCELQERYASNPLVTFTSRFELVLGTKPIAAG